MTIFLAALALVAFGAPFTASSASAQSSAASRSTAGATGTDASFRGLGIAGDGAIWVSGTRGTVLRSIDGGATWEARPIADAASFDLRDIEAISGTTAYAMVAGSDTGRIYKTTDGGMTWTRQYDDTRKGIFLDGIAFWDEARGIAFGDPIDGRFVILRTEDGGAHWTQVAGDAVPVAEQGEAGFAASGTSIRTGAGGRAWIGAGSGGNDGTGLARVLRSADYGRTWQAITTPIVAGTAGTGIFSLAFRDSLHGIAAGGYYKEPAADRPNVAITADGGLTWRLGDTTGATGYLSGVIYVPAAGPDVLVGVGTAGMFGSRDGGLTWRRLNALSSNAVAAGSAIIAAGGSGRVRIWPSIDAAHDAETPALPGRAVPSE